MVIADLDLPLPLPAPDVEGNVKLIPEATWDLARFFSPHQDAAARFLLLSWRWKETHWARAQWQGLTPVRSGAAPGSLFFRGLFQATVAGPA